MDEWTIAGLVVGGLVLIGIGWLVTRPRSQSDSRPTARPVVDWLLPDSSTAARTTLAQVAERVRQLAAHPFGRDPVLDTIDGWMADHDRGMLVVTAPSGTGKSALLAAVADRRAERGDQVVVHFFHRSFSRTTSLPDAYRALLAQLARRGRDVDEQAEPDDDLARILGEDHDPALVVIIDALDEADELVPAIESGLGRGAYVVVSARAEAGSEPPYVRGWLPGHLAASYPVERVELEPLEVDGVAAWLASTLPIGPEGRDGLARRLHETTDGVPLFLFYVLEDLAQLVERGTPVDELAEHLGTLPAPFTTYAKQQLALLLRVDRTERPALLLGLLCLARAPVPAAELPSMLGEDVDTQGFLDTLDHRIARWLAVRFVDRDRKVHAFAHPRLAEVFREVFPQLEETRGVLSKARERLLDHCWRLSKVPGTYATTHVVQHALEGGQVDEVVDALTSPAFLQARVDTVPARPLLRQISRDFASVPEDARSPRVQRWQSFWAHAEPVLVANEGGFGDQTCASMLGQLLHDQAPLLELDPAEVEGARLGLAQVSESAFPLTGTLRVMTGHAQAVLGALPLPDGRFLSWAADGTLRQWGPEGAPGLVLQGHTTPVGGVSWLPDGRLVSWAQEPALCVWDDQGGVARLEGHTLPVRGVQDLVDGVLSWSADGTLRRWDAEGNAAAVFEGHDGAVTGATVLADGRILSWSEDETLRIWRADGTPDRVLEGHPKAPEGALALPGGSIVSWGRERTLRWWSPTGEPTQVRGHRGEVLGASVVDGRVVSWGNDGSVRFWDERGESLATIQGPRRRLMGVRVLSDGRVLTWARDRRLRLWEADGALGAVLEGHTGHVLGGRELPDGRFVSWSRDRSVRLWSPSGALEGVLDGHTRTVRGVEVLSDGRLLSWSNDHTLRLWGSDAELDQARVAAWWTASARLADGRLASGGANGRVTLWAATGRLEAELDGHGGFVEGAGTLGDGRIVTWGRDRTLRRFGATGELQCVFQGHRDTVGGFVERPAGRILSWSYDGTLRQWNDDGTLQSVFEGHDRRVRGAVPHPHGGVVSWSNDGTVRRWDDDGGLLATMVGHSSHVFGVCVLRDGRVVSWAVKGEDSLRLWTADGAPQAVLEGHSRPVHGVCELEDGLLSWSADGDVRRWRTDGTPDGVFGGHTASVRGLRVLADGRWLSWSSDRTMRLRSAEGEELAVLVGHERPVLGTAELDDGRLVSWDAHALRTWTAAGAPQSAWLEPYDTISEVHVWRSEPRYFWVLTRRRVLQVWELADGPASESLERARWLFAAGQVAPAAVEAGARLERFLRATCEARGLTTNRRGSLAVYNDLLKGQPDYPQARWRQIRAWIDLRNAAAHGNDGDFVPGDVPAMIEGIDRLMAEL